MKTLEEQGVEARSLAHSTFGLRGVLELWDGNRMNDKRSIITWVCTNQTTSWLVHSLGIFGARTSHEQSRTHKTHKTHHSQTWGKPPPSPL
jgi:hypothetical protein